MCREGGAGEKEEVGCVDGGGGNKKTIKIELIQRQSKVIARSGLAAESL